MNLLYGTYTPTVQIFTDHSGENSVDQRGSVNGRWQFPKVVLSANSNYQSLSTPDADVGGRVKRTVITSNAQFNVDLTEKTAFEMDFNHTHIDYERQVDSTEWINQDWLNYQLAPKTNIGLGLTLGALEVDQSPTQTYEQALLRAVFNPAGKLFVNVFGGVEVRQSQGQQGDPSGVFKLAGIYNIFDGTSLSLEGVRKTENSALQRGENFTLTSFDLQVRQRFFQKAYTVLGLGYAMAEYRALFASTVPTRSDHYVYARPSVVWEITKQTSMEAACEYRRNTSTIDSLTYDQVVASLQINLLF